ncbi:MAG: stealth family protein [Candidatus Gastranaerophilales bacterium]
MTNGDFAVDLVYLWVDGNDIEWLKKRNRYSGADKNIDPVALNEARIISSDELKYSLRSVEKHTPWINKIHIVTDNQIPKWLNMSNNKINLVDLKDLFDEKHLPIYNSNTIESRLPYIKGLSEHFLYANDDMLFFSDTKKSFFFKIDGKPIFRFSIRLKEEDQFLMYQSTVLNSYEKTCDKLGRDIKCKYLNHHNIDAYKKSDYIACINEFKEEYDKLLTRRFRTYDTIERTLVAYYCIANKKAHYKNIEHNRFVRKFCLKYFTHKIDAVYFPVGHANIEQDLLNINPYLFCVNDNENATQQDRENMKILLEKLYPNKSAFEV